MLTNKTEFQFHCNV